jgi:ABC-type antimicrobial peptide transport system permease subunit
VALMCVLVAVAIGFVSAAVPAFNASRIPILTALRDAD